MAKYGKVYNLTLDYGSDTTIVMTVSGLNLADYPTAKCHIRKDIRDTSFLELSTDNGGLIILGQVIHFNVLKANSLLIADGSVYDIFLIDTSGKAKKIVQGKISVINSSTRWT
jgi:hypothetical protein